MKSLHVDVSFFLHQRWRGYSKEQQALSGSYNSTLKVNDATKWTWDRASTDQGLLYHWTKYVKGSVSIIIGDQIENWSTFPDTQTLYLEEILDNSPLTDYSCLPTGQELSGHWGSNSADVLGLAPFRDFIHYTGDLVSLGLVCLNCCSVCLC